MNWGKFAGTVFISLGVGTILLSFFMAIPVLVEHWLAFYRDDPSGAVFFLGFGMAGVGVFILLITTMEGPPEPESEPETPDDRAVSPVIGVILMVAITVVLAVTVGTFAFGLVDDATVSTPPASFTADYDTQQGQVTVTFDSGQGIDADRHRIAVVGSDSGTVCTFEGYVTAGETCTGSYTPAETIRVVYEPAGSEQSATLYRSDAPAT